MILTEIKNFFFIIILVICMVSLAQAATKSDSKPKKKTQTLMFDGMDVNSAVGTPRSSLTSAAEKSDFDYFFNTDVNFEEKIINSLESVR